MRHFLRTLIVVLPIALVVVPAPARAASATYTGIFTAGGTFGGQSFEDAVVTIVVRGDTDDIHEGADGRYILEVGAASVEVAGIGVGAYPNNVRVISHPIGMVAFHEKEHEFAMCYLESPALTTYDLKSSIDVALDSVGLFLDDPYTTTFGDLMVTQINSPIAFTAAVQSGAVPEPSTFALLAVPALLSLGLAARRTAT